MDNTSVYWPDNLTLHYNIDEFKQDVYKKGLNIFYKGQLLEDNLVLDDYKVEQNACLIVESGVKKENNKIEFQMSEEQLKEGYNQIKGIFNNMYEEELIKIALKKNKGDIENTVIFLTDESNIETIKK